MWSLKITHFHTSSPAKRIKITLMLQIFTQASYNKPVSLVVQSKGQYMEAAKKAREKPRGDVK